MQSSEQRRPFLLHGGLAAGTSVTLRPIGSWRGSDFGDSMGTGDGVEISTTVGYSKVIGTGFFCVGVLRTFGLTVAGGVTSEKEKDEKRKPYQNGSTIK